MLKYGSIFVVTMMVCFWGGICVGGLLKGISLQELFAEKGTKMVEYAGIMLVGVVLIFPVVLLSVTAHEFGHFLFGRLSGYGFVSFRVLNWVLLRDNGRRRVKRFSIPGTLGQCLMAPPEKPISRIPSTAYFLGGVAMNFLLAPVAAVVWWYVPSESVVGKWIVVPSMLLLAIVNSFLLLTNGIPMCVGGIANDGENALSMKKNTTEKMAFMLLLRINSALQSGKRLKELPREWLADVEVLVAEGMLSRNLALYKLALMCDLYQFQEALELMEELHQSKQYTGILQYELECEITFLSLVLGRKEQAMTLWNQKPLRRYTEEMQSSSSSKCRLLWAVAKYQECDEAKAQRIFAHLQSNADDFLMAGEVKSDIAIIRHLTATDVPSEGEESETPAAGIH